MKSLICLFGLLFTLTAQAAPAVGGNPCQDPGATVTFVTGATSTTSSTQIVALVATQRIFLCSVDIWGVSGTNPTFSLQYGTGTNCASGATVIVPAFATVAATFYQPVNGWGPYTAPGTELCYLDGGASPIENYLISYVQQ